MRESEYYMLRPMVACAIGDSVFENSILQSGPLGIYLNAKMNSEEAKDLIFYLEKKMPYISGVDSVTFMIDMYHSNPKEPELWWHGRFRNRRSAAQTYSGDNLLEFLS